MTRSIILKGIAIGLPLVFLSICLLGFIAIHTTVFRNFLALEIRKQAYEKTGARIEVGTIEIPWTRLAVVLHDVIVHGSAAESTKPVAQANRIEVGLRVTPLLRGRIQIRDFLLDEPVVRLRIDSSGRSNLPTTPQVVSPSSPNIPERIFSFEIGSCAIHSGEVYYNDDAHTPLDAELHGLTFQSNYRFLAAEYEGSLAYTDGRITTGAIHRLAHSLELKFHASRTTLFIERAQVTIGQSRIGLSARLRNYENPTVDGKYEASLYPAELAALIRTSAPEGRIDTRGSFGYQGGGSKAFVQAVSIQGVLHSPALSLRHKANRIEAKSLSANYQLQGANLSFERIAATVFGGSLRGRANVLRVNSSAPTSRFDASLQGISLGTLSNILAPREMRRLPLTGAANLSAAGEWTGPIDTLTAHARLAVSSSGSLSPSSQVIPVNGLIQADYNGPQKSLSFDHSLLQTANTKVAITGTLRGSRAGESQIKLMANTNDLREATTLAELVEAAIFPSAHVRSVDLTGTAALNATITGSIQAPQIQGHLTAANLTAGRSRWRSLSVYLGASPSQARVMNGELVSAIRGQARFGGMIALRQWSPALEGPLALQMVLTNLSVSDLAEMTQFDEPVSGTLSGNISLSGTGDNPQGKASLIVLGGSAWREPFDNLTLNAQFQKRSVHSSISLKIPAGTIAADATYSLSSRAYALKLQANGVRLAQIALIQSAVSISGTASLSAQGSGTLENPQLQANLAVPDLRLQGQAVSATTAQFSVANDRAEILLHAGIDQGALDGRGDVTLSGARYATLSLDIRSLPAAALLTRFLPTEGIRGLSGNIEAHLAAQGPLAFPAQMEARLEIPPLTLKYADSQISLPEELQAIYSGGILRIQRTRVEGPGTNFTFAGAIPIRSDAPYALSADGNVDLALIEKFDPEVHSSGHVDLHLDSGANSRTLDLRGTLSVKDAALASDSIPVGIESLNAQVNLSGNRADIINCSGMVGGGHLTARGFFTYGHESTFNVSLDADSVRVRYPAGLRSVLSAQLALQGSPADSALTGRLLVDRLSFTQDFDLGNVGAFFSSDSSASSSSAFARHMKLNVALQSAQALSLANSKVSVAGSANLRMTGTLNNPILLGRVALTSGDVFFLSKRFTVQSGTISFSNPARTIPVLNLQVATTVEQYDITMNLHGPVDRLGTDFTSTPSLPSADIIHLLAFGNTTAEANAQPAQSAQMGAESVLASGVSGRVSGKLENVTGLSQITLDPLTTNSQGSPGTQLAIQERVTGSILFTFSTDLTSTQYSTAAVQYQINKKFSVNGSRDPNGGYALDLRFHKVF